MHDPVYSTSTSKPPMTPLTTLNTDATIKPAIKPQIP